MEEGTDTGPVLIRVFHSFGYAQVRMIWVRIGKGAGAERGRWFSNIAHFTDRL